MSEPTLPQPRTRWRHRDIEREYEVLMVTNEHATRQLDFPTTVVYQDTAGRTWSRPLSEWAARFEEVTR